MLNTVKKAKKYIPSSFKGMTSRSCNTLLFTRFYCREGYNFDVATRQGNLLLQAVF